MLALAFALSIAVGTAVQGAEKTNASVEVSDPSPVRLIGARCIFCHGPALMLAFSRRTLDEGGRDALDAFLTTHHVPDDEARDAIVRFLSQPLNSTE
jgi:hypothetical protein